LRLILNSTAIARDPQLALWGHAQILDNRGPLAAHYPNFFEWLEDTVWPGLRASERTIVFEMRQGKLAAFMILKHTQIERKLCTLRVLPDFGQLGIGPRLFETAFDILDTEKPLLSVAETQAPRFEKLFRHFGFEKQGAYVGLYRPGQIETSFNGLLVSSLYDSRNTLSAVNFISPGLRRLFKRSTASTW
jgi:hypothetical protein